MSPTLVRLRIRASHRRAGDVELLALLVDTRGVDHEVAESCMKLPYSWRADLDLVHLAPGKVVVAVSPLAR